MDLSVLEEIRASILESRFEHLVKAAREVNDSSVWAKIEMRALREEVVTSSRKMIGKCEGKVVNGEERQKLKKKKPVSIAKPVPNDGFLLLRVFRKPLFSSLLHKVSTERTDAQPLRQTRRSSDAKRGTVGESRDRPLK